MFCGVLASSLLAVMAQQQSGVPLGVSPLSYPLPHLVAPSPKLVKLPPFWDHDVEGWLVLALNALGMTTDERVMWHSLIAALSESSSRMLRDVILRPFVPGMVPFLVSELRSRLAVSSDERLDQLLGSGDLRGVKPSHKLFHLRALVGSDLGHIVTEPIVRKRWLDSLDWDTQRLVLLFGADGSKTTEQLAVFADTLAYHSSKAPAVKQVASIDVLAVRKLSPKAPEDSPPTSTLCWYHAKFGSKARQCRGDCTFVPKNQ